MSAQLATPGSECSYRRCCSTEHRSSVRAGCLGGEDASSFGSYSSKACAADDGIDGDNAIEAIWRSALTQAEAAEADATGSVAAAQSALDAAVAAQTLAQATATSAATAAAAASRVAAEAAAKSGFCHRV